jgi:hypothetical protein
MVMSTKNPIINVVLEKPSKDIGSEGLEIIE